MGNELRDVLRSLLEEKMQSHIVDVRHEARRAFMEIVERDCDTIASRIMDEIQLAQLMPEIRRAVAENRLKDYLDLLVVGLLKTVKPDVDALVESFRQTVYEAVREAVDNTLVRNLVK